jgi:hypothetical protein
MVTFQQYDQSNKHIYELYKSIAVKMAQEGRRQIGSKYIFEAMRYDYTFNSNNDSYKVNNNFAPMYARKFVLEHPQYGNLFKFKPLKGSMLM